MCLISLQNESTIYNDAKQNARTHLHVRRTEHTVIKKLDGRSSVTQNKSEDKDQHDKPVNLERSEAVSSSKHTCWS